MLTSVLFQIGAIIGAGVLVAKAFELWLKESEVEQIRHKLESVKEAVEVRGPKFILLLPPKTAVYLVERFLQRGAKARPWVKMALIASFLFICSLQIVRLVENKGLDTDTTPWETLDNLSSVYERERTLHLDKDTPSYIQARLKILSKLSGKQHGSTYALIIFFCTYLLSFLALSCSLWIVKRSVSELTALTGNFTFVSHLVTTTLFTGLIAIIAYTFLCTLLNPMICLMLDIFISLLFQSPAAFLLLFAFLFPLSFLIAPAWCKWVIAMALLPGIMYPLLLFFGIIFQRAGKRVRSFTIRLIEKSIEWKAGPVTYLISVLTLLSALIAFIVQALPSIR